MPKILSIPNDSQQIRSIKEASSSTVVHDHDDYVCNASTTTHNKDIQMKKHHYGTQQSDSTVGNAKCENTYTFSHESQQNQVITEASSPTILPNDHLQNASINNHVCNTATTTHNKVPYNTQHLNVLIQTRPLQRAGFNARLLAIKKSRIVQDQPETNPQMAATDGLLKVLEKCRISPPQNTVGEQSIPLTFFDMAWILFHPVHQLFFYDYPHSKADFVEKVFPNLKHSLSVTLQHFFLFASNLIAFPAENHSGQSRKPEFRYVEGDSLALTFAECDLDFNDLKGNHPRDCNKFDSLVPLLESGTKVDDYVKIPAFAIQVTIFPNSGITIGLTNHHALCDARSRYDFLMAWTSIAKHGTDEMFLASASSLPFYDRVIEYPNSLDEMLLSLPPIKNLDEKYKPPELVHQTDKVRAIFVLTRTQINRLKKWLLVQLPTLDYVSSFTVGCAYVWSCIAKSRVHVEGKKGEYDVERFSCVADLRGRLDPPVPQTYFGNCVGPIAAPTKTTLLTAGNKGFAHAVEVLGNGIKETLKFNQGVFKDAEMWLERAFLPVPTIGVAGTPKLNVYDVDFGWGKPQKYETISLDYGDSISVNAGKDSPGDLEIGLCLSSKQMDAFLTISSNELESILLEQE